MDNINIKEVFSEHDKKFNKMLVKEGKLVSLKQKKKPNRNYDFSSEILEQYSRKRGILDEKC